MTRRTMAGDLSPAFDYQKSTIYSLEALQYNKVMT